jgi:hypothetical protein
MPADLEAEVKLLAAVGSGDESDGSVSVKEGEYENGSASSSGEEPQEQEEQGSRKPPWSGIALVVCFCVAIFGYVSVPFQFCCASFSVDLSETSSSTPSTRKLVRVKLSFTLVSFPPSSQLVCDGG